jgi:hypothetical protein
LLFTEKHFASKGTPVRRQLGLSVALTVCLCRILEISPESSSEREQISIALEDLKILEGRNNKNGLSRLGIS